MSTTNVPSDSTLANISNISDPLDEPLDPELTANIARIKSSLNRINDIWDELRHRRYVPTNEEIEAMAKEDAQYRTPLLDIMQVEGFYGPEPPEHIKIRLELDEAMAKELGEVIYV